MQPPHLQRSNASKGNTWNASRPSAAKATTSAAQARKVALLCCHYLDRLRVLAMASVVRLNGRTIDQMAKLFPNSDQGGDQQPLQVLGRPSIAFRQRRQLRAEPDLWHC